MKVILYKSILLYCTLIISSYSATPQENQVIEEYKAAIAANPHNLKARFLLGNMYGSQQDFYQAFEQFNSILEVQPKLASVLYNAAYCLKNLGRYEQAIKLYEQVIELEPHNSDAHQGKSHAQLALGDYAKAWPDFEYRWTKPRPDAQHFTQYMYRNGSLHNKTIVLRSEFGLGDTCQFIRYAQELKNKGATIIVHAQKPLVQLLSLCPYTDQVIPTDQPLPPHDFSTVLMSLPLAFNTTRDSIPRTTPYLFADQTLVQEWRHKLANDKKIKIGICWNGNAYDTPSLQKLVAAKSIPLVLLAQLQNKNISFYSLQKTTGTEQLKNIPADFVVHCFDDFDESHGRFMDTAALMKNLDLVITIDTSIAHIAGGLGVKTWILLPHVADWRWGVGQENGEGTGGRKPEEAEGGDWYSTMRLFRQSSPGNWHSVINQVKNALDELILEKVKTMSIEQLYQNGIDYTQQGNLAIALEYFKHAYNHLSTSSTIAHALGSTYRKLNDLDRAHYFYSRALQLNPNATDSSFGLALTLLTQGNNREGWELFNRWRSPEILKKCPQSLKEIKSKTVVILAEWGLGDMIHFMRYATHLKAAGARVIAQVHPPLLELMKGCECLDAIISAPQVSATADYYIPLLYLPTLCATTNETIPTPIPYIKTPQLQERFLNQIDNNKKLKIGICWDIGHHDTNIPAWQRSAPLEHWSPLATIPGIMFYSLQKNGLTDSRKYAAHMPIIDFGPDFDTHSGAFVDSAGVMQYMDLIITVDTAIAHLAGALGIKTWVLLPYSPDYRWGLQGDRTRWYPSMRLFRQKKPGEWKEVFEEVKNVLKEEIAC